MSASTGQVPGTAHKREPKRRNNRELARVLAVAVLAGLAIAFAVLNAGTVEVDWIFGSGHAPLIVVIFISLLVGIVLTHFAHRLGRWRRR